MRCSSHWRDYNTHTHDRLSEALVLHPNDTDRTERFDRVHAEYLFRISERMLHFNEYMEANPDDTTNAKLGSFWLILIGLLIPKDKQKKKKKKHKNHR